MQPTLRGRRQSNAPFAPKWRHFHPQATVYVKNPFDYDIIFQVADDQNVPYEYRMPAGKISELPGGPIATLGLKTIIDRLIGDNPTDAIHLWDPVVRARYEDTVIVRVKEAPQTSANGPEGPISLAADDAVVEDKPAPQRGKDLSADAAVEDTPATAPQEQPQEHPFPGATRRRNRQPQPRSEADEVGALATASLGTKDQLVEED